MCFMLYIAADQPIPTVPWDERNRKLHTEDLSDSNEAVARHFSKAYRKYIGSDCHCGCGFRHAMLQNGSWPEEEFFEELEWSEECRANHEHLHDFIEDLMGEDDEVELYGEISGGFERPSEIQSSLIPLSRILEEDFVFRECYRYVVTSCS